ncbi:MAG: hypothetical protein ACK559_25315, partial [bacterium]
IMLTAAMIGVFARQAGLSRGIALVIAGVNSALSLGILLLFRDLSDYPNQSADLGQTLTACLISGLIIGCLVWTLRPLRLPS